MVYIAIFIGIVLVKFILNIRKFFLCKRYLNQFEDWLNNECNISLVEKQPIIKKLVEDAGYGKGLVHHTATLGHGYIAPYKVNPMDAFPNRYQHIAMGIFSNISSAIGVYKQRAFESFSPIFWIEFLIYLPKNILNYLGIERLPVIKVFNLLWWILGTIMIPILLSTYETQLTGYVKEMVNKING